jgi:autotransporter-associated beta strand protein
MKPSTIRRGRAALALLAVLSGGPLSAAPVAIGDASFEGNSLGPGGYAYDLAPEWTGTNGSNSGNAFEEYITGFVAAGTDHLGMENGYDVWQDLGVTYQANTRYTLTVAVGNRSGVTQAGNVSQYLLADPTNAVYATGSFDASALAPHTFADAPALVFDSPAAPAAIGRTIRILLRARGAGRSHFDNLRLDASPLTIPGSATVGDLSATAVTAASATLNGTVSDVGYGAPVITLFWGTSNAGTNAGGWPHSVTLPGTHSGGFSAPVTGLERATTYYFTARATNSAGSSWAIPSEAFETLPLAPTVATGTATQLGATTATLSAEVTDTGGQNPAVTIYYGTKDGGTSSAAWAHSVSLGVGSGLLSAPVSGLLPATSYFFRAFAQNSAGSAWAAASAGFTTMSVTLPGVTSRTTEGVTGTTANLRGEITDTGNDPPLVTLFYGTTDGGTSPAAWATAVDHGLQTGEFTRFVAGLSPSTPYFFRWRAVNAAGTAWSEAGTSFTTTALVPSGAVISEFHYNPLDNTSLEEFIELHNPGDTPLDLSGWTLSDAVTFTFPAGTTLAAGGYLAVAENPAALQAKYGVAGARGPWTGKLSSEGERIDLRNAAGILQDRVSYGAGFPWPTAADGAGPSAELLNPALDNDLGGSWRSSGAFAVAATTYIPSLATGWKYKKGTAEASNPVEAWRATAYDDSTWLTGQAGIGYGDTGVNTTLSDMRRRTGVTGYASVYFRKSFTVPAGNIPRQLRLRIRIDDGCVVWINGVEVDRRYVTAGQLAYSYLASSHASDVWDEIIIDNADSFLFGGTNVLAVHGFNTSLGSSDFYMDLELSSIGNSSTLPTPGKANSVARAATLVPPAIRQVAHTPSLPLPNQPVTVTARITDPDGMGAVTLSYQVVDPGNYIRKTDAAYATNWTSVTLYDNGTNGDAVAGDSTFTAVLPAALQTHRRLVRYRITCTDARGNAQTVPYADDEQPNFAYFVYAGVPAWTGALRPTAFNGYPATPAQTYPASLLESMPPLHLIATATDVANCQYNGSYSTTRFRGTVIHRGVIHDHIEFRVRGIGSTYQSGKNKWNIYFNRARDFQAYDNFGRPYQEKWNNLLVNANASPWASVNRGSGGVEEAVSNRIYQIGGMAAMDAHFFHFRVIDDALEASATDQYSGDLWGLYLGLEPSEGNFLDERGLPDGNVYAIEGGSGDKKHQGPTQPVDSSDWTAFRDAVTSGGQTEQWYRANVDLPALYTFLALNRLIGNVDVRPYDNYRFYHRPTDNRWVIFPYDMDMQFIAAHHWGGTMDGVVVAGAPNVILAISRHPNLAREYRNRCREILSLMASDGTASGGQIGQLIAETAGFINPPGQTLTWADLDAAMWNLHPRTTGGGANTGQSSHKGNFFRAYYLDGGRGGLGGTVATATWIRSLTDSDGDGFSDHEGMMQWFVNFSTNTWPGGAWNRKATNVAGSGTDSDPYRQRGFGYKYLEFEALYGGWIDGNNNPTTAANTDFPNKPIASYSGAGGFPVHQLAFTSGAFSDPQGAATYAAHEWRVAEIYAPGIPGYAAGTPGKYELQTVWSSGELTGPPGTMTVPLGVTEPGRTYRVRVRHKDSSGNWSYWSDPVQFAATPAPQGLLHYWNFNQPSPVTELLRPTQTIGGGVLAVAATSPAGYESGTGQEFAGLNARNGDPAGSHLRINYPLTAGTAVTAALPTTGFADIVVKYETRRSGQGAETQTVSYTLNGADYLPLATFTILDAAPVVQTLDFRNLPAADNNPLFGIRITFAQGAGGTAGNQRFDNLTVEAAAQPDQPRFLPGGNGDWNIASNWASAAVPDGPGAPAIIGAPVSADRAVTLTAPVTIGTLTLDQAASPFLNQLTGTAAATLTFAGGSTPAVIEATGTGPGLSEFDLPGGVTLATDLQLAIANLVGNPVHGALRLRGAWDGPGGLLKQGPGVASLTGPGKTFSGPLGIAQGVLQVTQPATPAQCAGVSVQPGGQLRLVSGNDLNGPRSHSFGGPLVLAGSGRGAEIPTTPENGVEGALRYQPDTAGSNRALVTNPVALAAAAEVHTAGPDNTLELTGPLSGTATLTKSGAGTLALTGASPAFTGPLTVTSGPLEIAGKLPAAPVELAAGTLLFGSGSTGALSGAGTVAPHLTTLTAPASAAADFDFVLEQPGGTGNSLLRLTATTAFPAAPATVDLFINRGTRQPGDRLLGGFFTQPAAGLAAALAASQVRLLVADPAGPIPHRGLAYRLAVPSDELTWAVVNRTLDFGEGPVTGETVEVLVGGLPTQYAQWRSLYFGDPADFANDAISGPMAAPADDGIANLFRYAHGVGPFAPVADLLPVLTADGAGGFIFNFLFDPAKTDLVWRVTATPDLADWAHDLFDSATSPIPPLVNGWLPVPLPLNLTGGPDRAPRLFTRLELTLTPPPP